MFNRPGIGNRNTRYRTGKHKKMIVNFTKRPLLSPTGALNVDVPDVYQFTTPSQQTSTPRRKGSWGEWTLSSRPYSSTWTRGSTPCSTVYKSGKSSCSHTAYKAQITAFLALEISHNATGTDQVIRPFS